MNIFKKAFLLFFSFLLILAIALGIHAGTHARTQYSFPKGSSYLKEWKKVDSLENKGLTQSALDVVMAIYTRSKQDNNAAQTVKAILYKIKLEEQIQEYSTEKAIAFLKDETVSAKFPLQPLLHSMLADIYWRYYTNNRYKFHNRTQTVNFDNTDITTWDLTHLVDQSIKEYQLSLIQTDSLKKIPLELYDDILEKHPESRKFRPTLYDFLAHRAIDFFSNDEPDITRPAYRFDIDNPACLSDAATFSTLPLVTKDSLSMKYYAIKDLQQLLAFHQTDKDPTARVDADLKRLAFVKTHGVFENKDSIYLNSLNVLKAELKQSNPASPCISEVMHEIATWHYLLGQNYVPLTSEADKWEKKTAIAICQEAIAAYPGSFGAQLCAALQTNIREKSMSLDVEKANAPGKPFRGLFTYKNMNKAYVRIVHLDLNHPKDLDLNGRYFGEDLLKQCLKMTPVKEFEITLIDDGDFSMHSAEIKFPDLPLGHYLIITGSDKSFSLKNQGIAYTQEWISDLSYEERRLTDGAIEFYVQNRQTGEPIKGAKAQLWEGRDNHSYQQSGWVRTDVFTTDENGYFKIPPAKEYRRFILELINGTDRFYIENGFYQYQGYKPQVIKAPKTFFFTDREIYRPGQTVFFKGICLQSDGDHNEILTHRPLTVTFYDANSQKQSSLDLTTNDFGSVSGSFTVPQGAMNGQMYIADGHGTKYFSVEEYKRPKFEVSVKPVNGVYRPDDDITVHGTAKAYSGANIDGAQVKYRVVRNATFPYWYYYWSGYYPSSPQTEITNGFTTTNDTGGYVIHFKALPDRSIGKDKSPTYTYTVFADVTDLNGETHSSSGYVSVGYITMNLSINISGLVNKEEKQKFPVYSANLNGQFEPAKGRIEIYKLKDPGRAFRKRQWDRPDRFLLTKDEFYSSFPNDAYSDEDNMYKWEHGEKVLETTFENTSSNSGTVLSPRMNNHTDTLFLKNISHWSQGYYVLEAHSTDRFGGDVKDLSYFTIYSEKEKETAVFQTDVFEQLKNSGEPGESAKILIGSKEDIKVLFETEYRNEPMKKQWIELNHEQKILELPIEEKDRGGFAYHFLFVKNNRPYHHDGTVTVPWSNKQLDISFETFRNKLEPGTAEQWKLKIKGPKGEKVAAEMLATLYDASLDAFRPNAWDFSIYTYFYSNLYWSSNETFGMTNSQLYADFWNPYLTVPTRYYETLNWFGYSFYNYWPTNMAYKSAAMGGARHYEAPASAGAAPAPDEQPDLDGNMDKAGEKFTEKKADTGKELKSKNNEHTDREETTADDLTTATATNGKGETTRDSRGANNPGTVKARTNFSETAFFFPTLSTDENGDVVVKFTVPEALTRWKMMGFAHTRDLMYGSIGNTLVTQKDLMVVPDAPRFFREGDDMSFTAKITSMADSKLDGTAQLLFFDALSMKPIDDKLLLKQNGVQDFSVAKGASTVLKWDIHIPEGYGAISYRVVAKSGSFSDGEEMVVPVLTNRMLVTESMPLPIRSRQTKVFTFEKFMNQNNHSPTLRNHKLTLEFTANPAWYAVQALPYLMEYPYECAEQTFSRFYANSIASHIANSSPKIKAVFDSWKSQSPDALLSNLQKNQELKSLMLEETPWVLDAKDESERKKRVALLFDLTKMSNELDGALRKLQKMQLGDGAWPWFDGMPEDRYITQYIVTGMGHLDHLGVSNIHSDAMTWNMVRNGVKYLDNKITEDYNWILEHDREHLDRDHLYDEQIQYLYARSYFKDIPVDRGNLAAFNYYKAQAQKYWLNKGRYMDGMIALALFRNDDTKTPNDILKSLKETSISSEEMGMYWKENYDGFYWYQAPIEAQALLIEAFDEVAHDPKSVDDLKVWLLKSKQTQDWKTTKATSEACYALLLRGTDWLSTESNIDIKMGELVVDPKKMEDVKVEAGTGYFKKSWSGDEIKPEMGKVTVSKKDEGVSWGAVYWQYFEQLDKITPHDTPLKLNKKLFVEHNTASGPVIEPLTAASKLKPGDKIKVRIELKADRDMQYVHMKDMRASCFEPTNVISQYKYHDGLGYYESTRDASTNFFFSWLPKGNYVFEYPLMVTHNGNFSNGITSIQCMYAPEFASHSEGVRVKVGE